MTKSIDELLNGTKETEEAEVPEPKAEEKPPETTEAKPQSDPQPKGVEKAEPPSAGQKADEMVPKSALLEERRKRQELEARVQTKQQEQKPPPDVLEDPDGYRKHIAHEMEQKVLETRVSISEANARTALADFDEIMGNDGTAFQKWIEAVQSTPGLYDKFAAHPDPVRFAYDHLKRQRALEEIGDPVAYRERVRKEIEAELAAKQTAEAPPEPPKTTAGTPTKAPRSGPEWSGPKPIGQLLGRKRAS